MAEEPILFGVCFQDTRDGEIVMAIGGPYAGMSIPGCVILLPPQMMASGWPTDKMTGRDLEGPHYVRLSDEP